MDEPNSVRVTFSGRTQVIGRHERLGFGRANQDTGARAGWGYAGRFLELGPSSHIHRLWGEIVWLNGWWCVRALGSVEPVHVSVMGGPPIELSAWTEAQRAHDLQPEILAVTRNQFAISLSVGADAWTIECRTDTTGSDLPGSVAQGNATVQLGEQLADSITGAEFAVLWVMSREYRERGERTTGGAPDRGPARALSYSRIQRALGLSTERQATAAVERLVRRFRGAGVLPEGLPSNEQRDRICEIAVAHRLVDHLEVRYGRPLKA